MEGIIVARGVGAAPLQSDSEQASSLLGVTSTSKGLENSAPFVTKQGLQVRIMTSLALLFNRHFFDQQHPFIG
jgi:hypothetical protein